MSQRSFVLLKDLHFTNAEVYGKGGDTVVWTPPEKLIIYRNGSLIANFPFSPASVEALVCTGFLQEEGVTAAAPPVLVIPPSTPKPIVQAITKQVQVPAERVEASLAQAEAGQTVTLGEAEKRMAAAPEEEEVSTTPAKAQPQPKAQPKPQTQPKSPKRK